MRDGWIKWLLGIVAVVTAAGVLGGVGHVVTMQSQLARLTAVAEHMAREMSELRSGVQRVTDQHAAKIDALSTQVTELLRWQASAQVQLEQCRQQHRP